MMNPQTYMNLKATLYDLLEEKKATDSRVAELVTEAKDKAKQIDDLHGELHASLNVSNRRAEMIRELTRENRKLVEKVQSPKPELTSEVIDEVNRVLQRSLVHALLGNQPVKAVQPYEHF